MTPDVFDAVFAIGADENPRQRRWALAVAVLLHLAIGAVALQFHADEASHPRENLTPIEVVAASSPPPSPSTAPPTPPHQAQARAAVRSAAPPVGAAAAPSVVTDDPSAPVDYTQDVIATGTAIGVWDGGIASISGSALAATGSSQSEAAGKNPGVSGARGVTLDERAWNCPWPSEANEVSQDVATVVLRAVVGPDGRAEHVDIVADYGFGFGAAALRCALRTRFQPARDAMRTPIRARSPPIRVTFRR